MLSDALRQMRGEISAHPDLQPWQLLLMAFEAEAGAMELRIHFLTGRPHCPLPILDIGFPPQTPDDATQNAPALMEIVS